MNSKRSILEGAVPGLDAVMGGSLPDGDMLFIVGSPGSGKTTLAFQNAFFAASAGHPVVFVSTVSEPVSRLISHFRRFSFWKDDFIGERLFLTDVYPFARKSLDGLLEALVETVSRARARLLVLDGFATLRDLQPGSTLPAFVHDLAVQLLPLSCTSLITSSGPGLQAGIASAELTMCDAIVELEQTSAVTRPTRSLRAWKMRGYPNLLGPHFMRIDEHGLRVFPRIEMFPPPLPRVPRNAGRWSSGSRELDEMLCGGLPEGSTTIVAGASGTGKTQLCLQFLSTGAREGRRGMFVAFREPAAVLEARGEALGIALVEKAGGTGSVRLLRRSSAGAHIDEVLNEVLAIADEDRVERLVIDGLQDLLQAIPEDRRAHEIFARLAELLWARGITSLLVLGTPYEVGPELDFTSSPAAAMAENVLLLRPVELGRGQGRAVSVVKMAASSHDTRARPYVVTAKGLRVLARTESPEGFLQGVDDLSGELRGKPAPLPSAPPDDDP